MKKRAHIGMALFLCELMFVTGAYAAELPDCDEALGQSPISREIIFYGMPPTDYCLGKAAAQYIPDASRAGNLSVKKILAEAPYETSFLIVGGNIVERAGKNFLSVNILTVRKTKKGAYQGWLIVRDRDKGAMIVRRFFSELSQEQVRIELLMSSNIVLFARIRSSATLQSITRALFDMLIQPYLQFISKTSNLECKSGEENA